MAHVLCESKRLKGKVTLFALVFGMGREGGKGVECSLHHRRKKESREHRETGKASSDFPKNTETKEKGETRQLTTQQKREKERERERET